MPNVPEANTADYLSGRHWAAHVWTCTTISEEFDLLSESAMPSKVTNPPDGWSVADGDMQTSLYWGDVGEGTLAAKAVGLTAPQPVMIKSRDTGGDAYVFMSGGKVYLWNMVMGDVWVYTKPSELDGILAEMGKPAGTSDVNMELVHQVV
ncbi:hypothetical protein F4805DRAFT_457785 [Annulohypoxylon moriforme]|nr:hypothetical protein F4805DRAFT_457785 [Annulohypoxylon moriforme]